MLKPHRLNLLKRRRQVLRKMHGDKSLPKKTRLQAKKALRAVQKGLRLHRKHAKIQMRSEGNAMKTPWAIVIAGALIAVGIVLSNLHQIAGDARGVYRLNTLTGAVKVFENN